MSPIRVYEIYVPEIGTFVKYKVLSPEAAEEFVAAAGESSREEYIKRVLENVVFNMKTEIVPALREMTRKTAQETLEILFNGCVMLNPGLDIDSWVRISYQGLEKITQDITEVAPVDAEPKPKTAPKKVLAPKKITRARFDNLEQYLKEKVVGQNEAVESVVKALKRSQAGLNDELRPLGVFLFCGPSGVGKSLLAKELHNYLFADKGELVRVDCGELQHKHENQKLSGSPPGYLGYEDGGALTNQMLKNPETVVLLDEVEKAHPDIWDTFLRVFDEGILTNNKGEPVSFRNSIIILTTNLGNNKVVDFLTSKGVGFGARTTTLNTTEVRPSRDQVIRVSNEAIKERFKPEFLNRIDKTVVFNHLSKEDFTKIAELEMLVVDDKLGRKGNSIQYDDSVIEGLIKHGVDSIKGARGMSQVRREMIEDPLSELILSSRITRGTIFDLSYSDDEFKLSIRKPTKVVKAKTS